MGSFTASRTKHLWLAFTIGFTFSLAGAAILFIPTLEFLAVDVIEKLGLPIGLIGNAALYIEFALLPISTIGLVIMSIIALRPRR